MRFRRQRVGTGFSPISAAACAWALIVAGPTIVRLRDAPEVLGAV